MAVNRESVVAAAEKYVARGKIDSAIKEYRKLIAESPNDAMTLNRLGDLYVRIERIEDAVKLFLQIAQRYTEDGFFVKAIAIFKKIIKLDPTRLPIYEHLAELYHKQGLVTEARTQYQVLVDYYLKHQKAEAAEAVLRKMTALDSGDPSPHVKLAEIYRDRGEHDNELAEYRALAEMMLRHKRVDEATQVYAKAIAAFPSDLAFITDAVLGLKDDGHTGAAAKLLALAVEKNPQAEKIARLAGLGRGGQTDLSSSGIRRGVFGTAAPKPIKVSDIAQVPPELRETARPAPGTARGESTRAQPSAEELESARGAGDELAVSGLEWGTGTSAPSQPPPSMAPDGAEGVEFELEIESFDGTTGLEEVAPAAGSSEAEIDWSFAPEPDLELDLDLETPAEAAAPAGADEPSWGRAAPAEPISLGDSWQAVQSDAPVEIVESPQPAGVLDESAFGEPVELQEMLEEPASIEEPGAEIATAPPAAAPTPERGLMDLLAEAEVFRKYGLREKAGDRVRTILQEEPRHAGALALAVHLLVDDGKFDRALIRGQQLERLAAADEAAADAWAPVRSRLEKAGFSFESGGLAAAPIRTKREKDAVAKLLDELAGAAPARRRARPQPAAGPDVAARVDELRSRFAAPTPAVPPPDEALPALPELESAAPSEPRLEIEEALADDKLSWLDEAAPAAAVAGEAHASSAADEALFDEEEGFFDLAAELEQELTKEALETGEEMLPREEPSLEEIVEGFKKGVAESLSPEDFDTHFNLGIAYREMGLLDEAIGEFQLAAKHPNYLLDCCSLLGGCFLEKGLPELAIKWYQRGLATEGLSEEANSGLLYDLGNLYLSIDDPERARRTFVELYGINSNYRDVVAKLEELRAL